MGSFPRGVTGRLIAAAVCLSASTSLAQTSIRHVQVLGSKDAVEIEVEASDRIIPQTQVLANPDRLVVDFPNAKPGAQLRSQSVYKGEVKDLRVGLFQAKPPVTRIVLDLKRAQSYQIFPGRTVIIKVMGNAAGGPAPGVDAAAEPPTRPGLVVTNYVTRTERIQPDPVKPLDVSFHDGMLAIQANKATLSEVLYAVQQRTGAEVAIAAGAEQERVVVDLGPGPAQEVLARLLNGSKFNFLIMNSAEDPRKLDRIILSPRVEGAYSAPLPPVTQSDDSEDDDTPVQPTMPQPQPRPAMKRVEPPPVQVMPNIPPQPPEVKSDDNTPDQ